MERSEYMIEKKIVKEMNAAYLIITSEQVANEFEIKMFTYNKIKGFLPLQKELINNKAVYRYQVAEMESILQHYSNKGIELEDVKRIFMAIAALGHQIEEFLLSTDGVLLDPECIFVDDEKIWFCYYPGKEKTFNKGIRQLMEYILERLDHSNKDTVMTAYGIYQKILKNSFTMNTLMEEFFRDDEPEFIKQESNEKLAQKEVCDTIKKEILQPIDDSQTKISDVRKEIFCLEEELLKESNNNDLFVKKRAGNKSRKEQRLNSEEKVQKKGFSLFTFKKKNQNKDNTLVFAEETQYNSQKEIGMGRTVLLSCKKLEAQNHGKDILLINTPLLIGSSREAEYVIENPMISRKHAIITYEKGAYYVTDTGSTNGTFINGSRLTPNKIYEVDNGDEIAFANEIYRLV